MIIKKIREINEAENALAVSPAKRLTVNPIKKYENDCFSSIVLFRFYHYPM